MRIQNLQSVFELDGWLWRYLEKKFLKACLFDGGDLLAAEGAQICTDWAKIF